jgi:hypothetical protein
MAHTYPGGQEEFISAGMRFYVRTDATSNFFAFRRVSGQVNHVTAGRVTGGALRVGLAESGTNFDSGSANIPTLTWLNVMVYARIHDTLGEFIVKLFDEVGGLIETLTQTGVDTLNAGNLAEISVWGSSALDTYVDQLWTDLTGTFRGCGYVETLAATGAGDNAEWTRGGTDTGANWDQIDEVPKNETSYVFSTAADQIDLYAFANRTQAGTPITVQQVIYAHAHTAGTREWKPICKIGGVVYEGATQSTTSTSDGTVPVVYNWQNNPATSGAWEDAEIDAAQFGVKSVTTDVRVQAVCLHVLVDIES